MISLTPWVDQVLEVAFMDALIQTLFSKRQELLIAIWQHIQISLISLLFALIIALPLALAVVHHQRTAGIFTQIAGFFRQFHRWQF